MLRTASTAQNTASPTPSCCAGCGRGAGPGRSQHPTGPITRETETRSHSSTACSAIRAPPSLCRRQLPALLPGEQLPAPTAALQHAPAPQPQPKATEHRPVVHPDPPPCRSQPPRAGVPCRRSTDVPVTQARGAANSGRRGARPGQRATQAASPPGTQRLPRGSQQRLGRCAAALPVPSHAVPRAAAADAPQLQDAPRPRHLPASLLLSPSCRHAAFLAHTWREEAAKLPSPCQGVPAGAGRRAASPGSAAGVRAFPGALLDLGAGARPAAPQTGRHSEISSWRNGGLRWSKWPSQPRCGHPGT